MTVTKTSSGKVSKTSALSEQVPIIGIPTESDIRIWRQYTIKNKFIQLGIK
ncbi:hypothetical protein [uncultured Shewanella sp.]|uniref:hypothetical protein n=1 Tax=uncultured Shewanella sp. TaxID=173975 RepID=UPI00262ED01E|nr:hypothetical protein [uncultured Shewanella sp.]